MKKLLFSLAALMLALAAHAQTYTVQKVSESTVPQVVRDARNGHFPNTTVTAWEKQTASGTNRSGDRFVAIFNLNGARTRARYYTNGKGVSATSYLTVGLMPQVIKDAAKANYAAYVLTSGEKILLMDSNRTVYRLRLRKGAQKLVVYVDANGKEVSRNQVPAEVLGEEGVN